MATMIGISNANPFYRGCTATELSKLFGMPLQTVRDSLVEVVPCGIRGKSDLYAIKEAARVLIRDDDTEAETVSRILRLRHTDLPKMLSKEYWAGQTAKQRYEIVAGDLWSTTKIVEWLSDAYKTLRLSLMLMADTVEREEALTPTQRQTITRMIDATLNDAAERLIRAFKDKRELEVGGSTPPQEDDGDEGL